MTMVSSFRNGAQLSLLRWRRHWPSDLSSCVRGRIRMHPEIRLRWRKWKRQ